MSARGAFPTRRGDAPRRPSRPSCEEYRCFLPSRPLLPEETLGRGTNEPEPSPYTRDRAPRLGRARCRLAGPACTGQGPLAGQTSTFGAVAGVSDSSLMRLPGRHGGTAQAATLDTRAARRGASLNGFDSTALIRASPSSARLRGRDGSRGRRAGAAVKHAEHEDEESEPGASDEEQHSRARWRPSAAPRSSKLTIPSLSGSAECRRVATVELCSWRGRHSPGLRVSLDTTRRARRDATVGPCFVRSARFAERPHPLRKRRSAISPGITCEVR